MIIRKKDNIYIIRIIKEKLDNFDFFNQDEIKELFQIIIKKIRKKNHINGILNVDVYVNEYYGMVIEIQPISSNYKEIDMHIHFHLDSIFLNEINEDEIQRQKEVYYYDKKFYSIYNGITDSNIIYKLDNFFDKCIKVI